MMTTLSKIPAGVLPVVKAKAADVIAATGTACTHVWGYASTPDHNNKRCVDFMVADRADGDTVAEYVIANAKRLGVHGLIWDHRCMGFPHVEDPPWRGPYGEWRDYTGPSPHTDHVHVEFDGEPIVGVEAAVTVTPEAYPAPTSGDVYLDKLRPGQTDSDSVWYWRMAMNALSFRGGRELPLTPDYTADLTHETRLFQAQVCNDLADGWPGPKQAVLGFRKAEKEMRAKGVGTLTVWHNSATGGRVERVW